MRLLRSELLKLVTVRTTWIMIGIGLLVEGLFAGLFVGLVNVDELDAVSETQSGVGLLIVMMLVLGALAITTEFRHGTASTTFLASPRRYPVMLAKLGAVLILGFGAGLAFVLVNGGLALPLYSSRTGGLPPAAEIVEIYAGVVVSLALICSFGLGVGAIIRNQVGAIIASLAFFFILSTLPELLPGDVGDYFPAQAFGSLQGFPESLEEGLSQVAGGLVLAAWCAALFAIGAVLTKVRDLNE